MNKIRVLIADDSALMRKLLAEILDQDPEIEVVGAVSDAFKAREEIKRLDPDVLTLDIEMPKMDGISFLEKLMRLRPMPVVMISAMTEKGADITMKALMLGAVDFISKPKVDIENSLGQYSVLIRDKVKAAASSRLGSRPVEESYLEPRRLQSSTIKGTRQYSVIGIGASTGGVEAVHSLLASVPEGLPPIVITQHIPPVFSASFARRLDEQVPVVVSEAEDGQEMLPGHAYVAPGDRHLLVVREGPKYFTRLSDDLPVNRHKPSVDVLFNSLAASAGDRAIGILLTGMGSDGAKGLLNLKSQGSMTIAQDRDSSTVWGMPREAIEMDAAQSVLALGKIAARIIALCDPGSEKGERRGIGSQSRSVG